MHLTLSVSAHVEKLKTAMAERGIDAAVLQKPESVYYFSRFNPIINSHPCFVVVTPQSVCLLVHSLRAAHAAEEAAIGPIHLYGRWGNTSPIAMTPAEAIAQILGNRPLRLGLETDSISLRFFEELNAALSVSEAVDLSHEIAMMKLIKDEAEISSMRKAAQLVDAGIETTIRALAGGCSEAVASTEGQYAMRRMWSEQFPDSEVSGFGTSEGGMLDSLHVWCMSNERIAYGCDCPRHYTPIPGDLTLPMAWAKVDGYHAENERCVMVGTVTGVRERAYHAMLEARQAVFETIRPGVPFEALFEQAATVYTAHGFGHLLPGRIGHGIGCAAHEFPSVTRGNHLLLAPGMVMSIEPGLLDREWGGVRHSDTVLVTEQGYECLTRLRRDIIRIDPPQELKKRG